MCYKKIPQFEFFSFFGKQNPHTPPSHTPPHIIPSFTTQHSHLHAILSLIFTPSSASIQHIQPHNTFSPRTASPFLSRTPLSCDLSLPSITSKPPHPHHQFSWAFHASGRSFAKGVTRHCYGIVSLWTRNRPVAQNGLTYWQRSSRSYAAPTHITTCQRPTPSLSNTSSTAGFRN